MCAFLRYSASGLAVLLTTAYVSVSAESGGSAFKPTVTGPQSSSVIVNRSLKGDRALTVLDVRTSTTAQNKPVTIQERKILEGCDPAFSPLTLSAKNNYANRCVV
jgi:hypothetical protein